MAKNIDGFIAKLPANRRRKIAKRTKELLLEEKSLREFRKALHLSQEELARRLKINQAAISKIEGRTDTYVSTLRAYIEALGGKLEIIARLPGKKPISISQFGDIESSK